MVLVVESTEQRLFTKRRKAARNSGNLALSYFYTVSQKLWVFGLATATAQKFVLK